MEWILGIWKILDILENNGYLEKFGNVEKVWKFEKRIGNTLYIWIKNLEFFFWKFWKKWKFWHLKFFLEILEKEYENVGKIWNLGNLEKNGKVEIGYG